MAIGSAEMGRRAEAYSFDVATRSDLEATCARLKGDFEAVDILVNNAGVTRDRSFRKMDRNEWDEVINVNLSSVFDVTRIFIDGMVARGWGRVINISSIVGRIGNIGQANYAAAKGRAHRIDQDLGPGICAQGGHRERHRARIRRDPHVGRRSR